MKLESTTNRVSYSGNGVTTVFPFPYNFIQNSDLVVIEVNNTTKAPTLKTITTHYTVTGAQVDGGGSVTMLVAPATGTTLVIYRDTERTQETDLEDNGPSAAESIELELTKRAMVEQRLSERADRSISLPESFYESFDTKLPVVMTPDYVIGINADGDGIELKSPAAVAGGAGNVPTGGAAKSVLTKISSADGDTEWHQHAFEGFSARFGEAFSSTDLEDTLNQILDITYTAPLNSFTASGSGTIREKGDAVVASTLQAAITKRSDPIAEVRFYQGASLLDTQTSGGGIPSGGNSTYSWTGSFSDNTAFSAQVDDNGDTGGPTTVTGSASFTFVYPYYVGAGAASLSAANVALLTKRVIVSSSSRTETITAGAGEVFFFAYPASYGALTSILDENGFETFGDWTLRTENITGLDGNAVSYRIYEFENPVTAGDYEYTFSR